MEHFVPKFCCNFYLPGGKQSLSSFQLWPKVYSSRIKGMCLYREIHQCISAFICGINTCFPQLWYLRSFYVFPPTSTLEQSDNFYFFICGNLKHRERYLRSHKWKWKQGIKLDLLGCKLVILFPFLFWNRSAYMYTVRILNLFKANLSCTTINKLI